MRTQSFIVRFDLVYDEGDEGGEPLTNFEDVKTFIEEDAHTGNYTIIAMTDVPYVEE